MSTCSKFSHAVLMLDHEEAIEAIPGGVTGTSFFCSELIAKAYQSVGLSLSSKQLWLTIPESERYNFETPSPATGELVEGDPYGLKERPRHTLPK